MNKKRVHLSLYIIIPSIFTGIEIIAIIVTYQLTSYYLKRDIEPLLEMIWLGIATSMLTFFCNFMILRMIMNPIYKFVKTAEKYPIITQATMNSDVTTVTENIDHVQRVLDQVTTVLGKMEASELFPEIIGQSRTMRGIFGQIIKVAPTDATVLIMGESGTGKELIATSLYEHSLRNSKPFIKINCVAIPEGLLESELFGHEKGAFTGAVAQKKGKFEMADGGTIFLDEIGDMPQATQAKLLRVLQEKEFERVGGAQQIRVDVRFITATNKNLPEMIKAGEFREDLYYRLNVFALTLPPLRERREDIPFLIDHFLEKSKNELAISSRAMQVLLGYNWPGNIRELKNVTERAAVFAEKTIEPSHFPAALTGGTSIWSEGKGGDGDRTLDERLEEIERGMIIEAINRAGGVQARAAQMLCINPRSLWHRIKKYGIDVSTLKKLQNM